ncbi:septum formation initiator family protein [Ureibacillus sp. FSL K6-3587]|uniref:FtsB family cell division protein n=1 Tax=Ureibacillus sp. FSL K6-3587 TaxID=2954681 RepID=UPI003158B38D
MNKRYGNKNIRKIENDYVRTADRQMEKLTKRKIGLRRRLTTFFIIASVVIVSLISTLYNQNQRLSGKEAEKEKMLAELQEMKEEQERLKLQIKKLEDDEYIAKLARKEYFLSDDGEIIFTIPKDERDKDKDKEEDHNDE